MAKFNVRGIVCAFLLSVLVNATPALCQTSQSLYGVGISGTSNYNTYNIYDLDVVIAGKSEFPPVIRTLPSSIAGNVLGLINANGSFYVSAQIETTSTPHPKGEIYRIGYHSGNDVDVGSTGYYFPYSFAEDSSGNVFTSFNQTYTYPTSFTVTSVGKISLSTGAIDSSTITTTSNAEVTGLVGISFDSRGILWAGSRGVINNVPYSSFVNWNTSTGAVTPLNGSNLPEWILSYGIYTLIVNQATGQIILARSGTCGPGGTIAATQFYSMTFNSSPYSVGTSYLGQICGAEITGLTYGPASIDIDPKGWEPIQNIFSKSFLNH